MIGYCAIGRNGIEIAPIRQMNSAITQAKIGLSIKKEGIAVFRFRSSHDSKRLRLRVSEIGAQYGVDMAQRMTIGARRKVAVARTAAVAFGPRGCRWFRRRVGRTRYVHRHHGVAGGEFLEAFDHHALAGLEAVEHQPLAVLLRTDPHRLHRDTIVRP